MPEGKEPWHLQPRDPDGPRLEQVIQQGYEARRAVWGEGERLYQRISLELISSWPGRIYLRLEPAGGAPAIMIEVRPADLEAIAKLRVI